MPDAGDFDKRGASASPVSWGDAFAALPQETPDAGGLQRLQARLPAANTPRVHRRWPLWLAAAATLALVVALPLRISRETVIDQPATASAQQLVTPGPAIANRQQLASASTPAPNVHDRPQTDNSPVPGNGGNSIATAKAGSASRRPNPPRIAPAQRPIRTVAEPAGAIRLAESDASKQPIEALYAESAQLEQLLAMVRDERVASGTSAALSRELDGRVAAIDDALTQPGLDADDRERLWQQRVDAMQQLVGIETTRVLAARGDTFNASLVSID